MDRPLASVVVPTWNGRDHVEACLGSLFAQDDPSFEVVVVDNASRDGTAELVAETFPAARLLRQARNLGFAGGTNLGCRAARGKILILLNQDAVAERDWIARLRDGLAAPGVGVAGSKALYPDGETVQMAGGSIHWPLGTVSVHGQYAADGPGPDRPREVDFVSGCGMAFTRDTWERVGPLDETFWPGYYEDADFCLRARSAGLACHQVPNARLRHTEGASFRAWKSTWRFHHRGRLHLVLKHTAPHELRERFLPTEALYQRALLAQLPGPTLARAYAETVRRSLPRLRAAGHLGESDERELADGLLRRAGGARREADGAVDPSAAPAECLAIAHEESCRNLAGGLRHLRFQLEKLGDAGRLAREVEGLELVIEARESELAATRSLTEARTSELDDSLRELASVRRVVTAREAEIATLRELVVARETEIEGYQGLVAARDGQLAQVQGELERWRRSFLGRVAGRLERLRRRLRLPGGPRSESAGA